MNGGFTIAGEKNFSDEELKDLDACLKRFEESYTKEELLELRGYMETYLREYGTRGNRGLETHSGD